MTHACTNEQGVQTEKRTPSQLASLSITELQGRLKSPIQFKLFARTDWLANKLALTSTEKALLHWLVYFGLKRDCGDLTFVTQKRLSQLTHLSTKTVARFVLKMECIGILKKFPQAIRTRDGQTVFGPMQNQFTSHAHALLTADNLQEMTIVSECPLHVQEVRIGHIEDNVGQMPENQQELQWLCDLLGNKYLVFKMMKLAAPHIRSGQYRGLDQLLQTYKNALLDGTIANPAAYLLTRLMSHKFGAYKPESLTDQELENGKLLKRRREEAQQAKATVLDFAKKKIDDLTKEGNPLDFIDLQTSNKVVYQQGQAFEQTRAGGWSTMNLEVFLIKFGTGKLAKTKPTDIVTPVRQIAAEMSDIQFKLSKFIKPKKGEPVHGHQECTESISSLQPDIFSKNNNQQPPSKSLDAIQTMRALLKKTNQSGFIKTGAGKDSTKME